PMLIAIPIAVTRPGRLTIGADGLLISRWFESRFISYSIVDKVQACAEGVLVLSTTGERIVLGVRRGTTLGHDFRAAAIIERVSEVLKARSERVDDPAVLALPARGNQSAAERVRALRGLGQKGGGDYRRFAVSPEYLFRVVDDPAARATMRADA